MALRRSFRTALIITGLVISVLFAYFAVRGVNWSLFWKTLSGSTLWWLAPALAVLAGGIFLRAIRWRLLFAPETRPPLGATTRALLVGTFLNIVLPARPGEVLRVFYLHDEAGTSRAEGLGTALTERIYDVFGLLVLLFASPWLPDVTWLRRAAALAIVAALLLAAVVGALVVWEERPQEKPKRPFSRAPRVSQNRLDAVATNLVAGLVALRRPRSALPALGLTFAAILVIALSFWLVTFALHLGVPFGAALLVMVATNLAMILPSSPAAVGVFEAATIVALRPYGVDASRALSYAVVLHALTIVPFVLVGLVLLQRRGLHLLRRPGIEA